MRLIDADELKKSIPETTTREDCVLNCDLMGKEYVNMLIDQAPTVDLWHYPSKGELPTERGWYLGIFEESDTGFRLAPVVCDYVGNQTKATTKEGWFIRCLEVPNEYYQSLKCIAWQYIRTDEVYLKCIAWKDRVPPKEEA